MQGSHTMRVTDIQLNVTQRSNKFLNQISFEDANRQPYVAEEPSDIAGHTRFKKGKAQSFRVTFPANTPGKKDWVEFVGEGTIPVPRENISIAIAAFNHVSKYEIGLKDDELMWRTVEVANLISQASQML